MDLTNLAMQNMQPIGHILVKQNENANTVFWNKSAMAMPVKSPVGPCSVEYVVMWKSG